MARCSSDPLLLANGGAFCFLVQRRCCLLTPPPSGATCRAEQQRRPPRPLPADHRLVHPDVPVGAGGAGPGPGPAAPGPGPPPAPALLHGGLPELPAHAAAGPEDPGAAGGSGPGPRGPGAGGEHPQRSGVRPGAHGRGCSLRRLYRAGRTDVGMERRGEGNELLQRRVVSNPGCGVAPFNFTSASRCSQAQT